MGGALTHIAGSVLSAEYRQISRNIKCNSTMYVFCGAKFSPVVSIRGQVNDPTRSYKNGAVFRNVADRNLLRQSIGTMTVSCRVTFTGYLHRHEKPLPKVDFNNRA